MTSNHEMGVAPDLIQTSDSNGATSPEQKQATLSSSKDNNTVDSADSVEKVKSGFSNMGLSPVVMQSLEKLGLTHPTPIQAQTIPLSMSGRDVLGSAQTGTGKTLAFGIPLIEKLLSSEDGSALILAPTRELAQQVMQSLRELTGHRSPLRMALLIGGEPIFKQFKQLRVNPRIVVGTPGRVIDHIMRRSWDPSTVNFLVLDETDRMLDMGFGIQLEEIIPKLSKQRQTLMFSATFPKNIIKLAGNYLRDPERVSIGSSEQPVAKIKQEVVRISEGQKYSALLDELKHREGSVIIFVKTKIGTERLSEKLNDENHESAAINGDLPQHKRERVIRAFRAGHFRIMVATDVAARGLDIPHIQHVINYDLPQCPEDYIHRIGRTGRAGAEGSALSFVTPQEGGKWHAINRYMNPSAAGGRDSDRGDRGGRHQQNNRPYSRPGRPGGGARFGGDNAGGARFGGGGARFGGGGARSGGDNGGARFGGGGARSGGDNGGARFGGGGARSGGDNGGARFGGGGARSGGDNAGGARYGSGAGAARPEYPRSFRSEGGADTVRKARPKRTYTPPESAR